ncbi:protein-methionine-sulfoxide reductase catalytic subunit MsrP [Duganella sp. sic0402]|uniref:protein-methionine-sulfoxide reductase catalytic subunit MsrP n=1 Tax=Duganella sp. sic0402 TaxID=2854786 RepID=UPI001C460BBC|nr:protein-methionine-sulfoxide reductase catalytic subunit MsrP [Duganella sp. sic0402]MBV7539312.1 protein-methionine-sulfoxide reductase catalytic subunit MsrP [Duganella sp. sic0402]
MLIKRSPNGIDLPFSSEITPRALYESRRSFMKQIAMGALGSAVLLEMAQREAFAQGVKLPAKLNPAYSAMDKQTPFKDASTYNNFYEFGTDKSEPAMYAGTLKTRPWTVAIEGEVKKPMTLDLDALLKLAPLEERVYRLRCVEGWSMVIPWIGYSFSEIIKKVEPTGNAKYVEFVTLADKKQMPGVGSRVLQWPYTEGLRIDEANHPLALLTFGMYGEVLPNQNGAPVRMVLPWKYGFKSAKSIVKIRFVKDQPRTSWNLSAPSEYGFYSNVNPDVDHPRWSQASERRIGEDGFLSRKRKTLMFNGYSDVASLYAGMDLKKFY